MASFAIIDYGLGNLHSVASAFEYLGHDIVVTNKAEEIEKAQAIVLPGVGANIFQYTEHSTIKAKAALFKAGIDIRLDTEATYLQNKP